MLDPLVLFVTRTLAPFGCDEHIRDGVNENEVEIGSDNDKRSQIVVQTHFDAKHRNTNVCELLVKVGNVRDGRSEKTAHIDMNERRCTGLRASMNDYYENNWVKGR